jgi:hypothetical protein
MKLRLIPVRELEIRQRSVKLHAATGGPQLRSEIRSAARATKERDEVETEFGQCVGRPSQVRPQNAGCFAGTLERLAESQT